jgi:uridine phosphorylase
MIGESELIINPDGTIFHLHLYPEQVADKIILVGDPGRVKTIAGKLESVEFTSANREFVSSTGSFRNQRITVISTGIGTDNIDIVMNELDALANIDLLKREVKETHRKLQLIRIGTSGGLQRNLPVNSWIVSRKSIGFDGMLAFYADRKKFCDLDFEESFKNFISWSVDLPSPYVVNSSDKLLQRFSCEPFVRGVNVSAPGFYGPQGRSLRLGLAYPEINEMLEKFRFGELMITNYEMESSAIYGLSKMLGHEALTVCLLIANRQTRNANEDYHLQMERLIERVLEIFTSEK